MLVTVKPYELFHDLPEPVALGFQLSDPGGLRVFDGSIVPITYSHIFIIT